MAFSSIREMTGFDIHTIDLRIPPPSPTKKALQEQVSTTTQQQQQHLYFLH